METTIDRASYRRKKYEDRENFQLNQLPKKPEKLLASTFYQEIILSMSILIGVLCIKALNLKDAEIWIKRKIDTVISYQTLSSKVIQKYQEAKKLLESSNIEENAFFSGEQEKEIKSEIIEKETIINEEPQAMITAIEGTNQQLEDADVIKTKYDILYPVDGGVITSRFGIRSDENPIVSSYHTGLDLAIECGTPILATHDGIVVNAGELGGYGNCIMLESGELTTLYGHCSRITVKKGDYVHCGEKIGEVGMTGNATGPHVHFEIHYQGRFVNPEDIMK